MRPLDSSPFHVHSCQACAEGNAGLRERIARLPAEAVVRRSHLLNGRYENIYVDAQVFPGIETILEQARLFAARLLGVPGGRLRLGWWLNLMQPGDRTLLHTHDDGDELVSGVYYVHAPKASGALMIEEGGKRHVVEPRAGAFVCFRPDLPHEVSENLSGELRISIGFNAGVPAAGGRA
jgi:hypothetical protein